MSGEFGQYEYRGYVDQAMRAIAENCMFGSGLDGSEVYLGTALVGVFLERSIAPLLKSVAYDEACDSYPDIKFYLSQIEGIRKQLEHLAVVMQSVNVTDRRLFTEDELNNLWDGSP